MPDGTDAPETAATSAQRASVPPRPTRAIVRAVSPRLFDAELTHLERRAIDIDLARRQHREYRQVLSNAGLALVEAPSLPQHPDGVFVEDAVVVVDDQAMLTRSGATSRRGEVEGLAPLLAELGYRVERLKAPATLDGGDVLQVGRDVYVGISSRTNPAAVDALGAWLAPLGRKVHPVEVHGALHLKTAATALPDGRIIAQTEALDVAAFGDRHLVEAPEASGANVLLLGDHIVIGESAPRTIELLREEGFAVTTLDLSEFEAVEAGPTCLSVLLS